MTELKVLTAEEQVANILAADARRVRRLTWVTVGMWLLTVLLTGFLIAVFQMMYQFADHTDQTYRQQREMHPVLVRDMSPEQLAIDRAVRMNADVTFGLRLIGVAVALLSLSALGTVLLVHASRRATLRQIQASLAAIAGQLADLQRGRGPTPGYSPATVTDEDG